MATWVRQGTGTAPMNTDSDLVGEYLLDNGTAPVDFDPAGVNSIRLQWTVTGSGFTDDSWDDTAGAALITSGGTEISQHSGGGPTGLQNVSESNDVTDSTGIPTGLSVAEWESARVRGDGTVIPNEWVVWVKNKAPDGSTLTVSALTVTIDYTPASSSQVISVTHASEADSAQTAIPAKAIVEAIVGASEADAAQVVTADALGSGLSGWSYRREVTVDNTAGAAKTNYAVKVELTSANFDFTKAETNGADVRFTDSDGSTLIDHWIEAWDDVAETATLWAEVPSIPATSSDTIYLYYGNGSAPSTSDIAATFLSGVDFTDPAAYRGSLDDDGDKETFFNYDTIAQNPLVQLSDITNCTQLREGGSIVHDPNDPNLGTNPEREYKMYFTAVVSSANEIWVLFSADGTTWGNLTKCTGLNGQDPAITLKLNTPGEVYRDGSDKCYLYIESNTADINVYESTDGIAWTVMTGGDPVIAVGAGGTWDDALVGSPHAVHDGTNFIVGYEGQDGSVDRWGIATGTAADSLTKSANNPLLSGADHPDLTTSLIIDDFWLAGSQIKLIGHRSSGPMFGMKTSELDPTAWVNADFSADGGVLEPEVTVEGLVNYAHPTRSQLVCTGWTLTEIVLVDVATDGSSWRPHRLVESFLDAPIDVISDQLVLRTQDGGGDHTVGIRTTADIGVATNFEIMARAKQEVQTDDQWAMMGFGSGAFDWLSAGLVDHRAGHANGYQAWFRDPGSSSGLWITELNGTRDENNDSSANFPASEANNFRVRKMRFLSDGTVQIEVGTATLNTTEATIGTDHQAGNKFVHYVQGERANIGAVSTVDWIAVRPYDGNDPAQTVGAEEAVGGPVTASISVASETDAAAAVAAVKPILVAVPLASETDLAAAVDPVKPIVVAASAVLETDASNTTTPVKPILQPVTEATEVSVAVAADPVKPILVAVTESSEVDAAQAVYPNKPIVEPVGQTSESETSIGASASKSAGVASATETDLALSVALAGETLVAVVTSQESDAAQATTPVKPISKVVGVASETDSAQLVDPIKVIVEVILAALETDAPINVDPVKSINAPVGIASATDLATAIGINQAGSVSVGVASETELAAAVSIIQPQVLVVAASTEVDSAQAISAGVDQTIAVMAATEADVAQSILPVKPIVQAITSVVESDNGEAINVSINRVFSITGVAEADQARVITLLKPIVVSIGSVSETDIARAVAFLGPETGAVIVAVSDRMRIKYKRRVHPITRSRL